MNRGEVWIHSLTISHTPSPRRELVVIVSDGSVINSPYRWLQGVPVSEADPGHVLATATSHGWADVLEQKRLYRPWLTDCVGVLTAEEPAALDSRLGIALGLIGPGR
ncbi:hypothetical protein IU474_16340 [Nocardia otitidiscaviarum]|uniref:hypothetical protein n=1 Tax=Nocardia otitidiscaviarum TaxID=1823 RepID=UPI001892F794|nr:hypothetical protein [Nocardia otitidiscaviarum]MBF6238622.1 hypothetical protein [Nocardia otitidiscaviarum]